MAGKIRAALAAILGTDGVTEDQLQQELVALKLDNQLQELTTAGHLANDLDTQVLARKFLAHDAEGFVQLMKTPRPTPAAALEGFKPPAAPASGDDPTETAIQNEMAKSNVPYHEAATTVSKGAQLNAPGASPNA